MTSTVIHNAAQLLTIEGPYTTPENPLGILENASLIIENGKITWIGPASKVSQIKHPLAQWVDATGQTVCPGLVDSHTHAIFAGDRANEFEMRLQGKSYLEIAQAGGGILKTVEATRKASKDELLKLTGERLMRMLSFGVTTAEVKSGYGLDFESEIKCLEVLADLQQDHPIDIVPTYMGAHDIPPEHKQDPDAYVQLVCEEQIPAVAERGLAVFCDVFCEEGYFSVAQSRKILETARQHGLKLKIHAEEFVALGGAELAGEMRAASADHLLNVTDAGIRSLKQGGTVANLLPGTAFFLRLKEYAPARKLIDAGVPVALSTDFNPGSCHTENLQLIMQLGCLQMGMTPVEAIRGVTINGAKALDLHHDRGSLEVGKRGDVIILGIPSYHHWLYHLGVNPVEKVFSWGVLTHQATG